MNDEAASVGSFGFAGAWTAAIPNGLILDTRLTATDKLLWMVIRCGIQNPSVPVSPTYDFLVETSHMARSSVARSLLALRIAGWMTGNAEQRADGYNVGARYLLHDRDRTDDLKGAPEHRDFVAKHVSNKGRIARLAALVGEQIGLNPQEIAKMRPVLASSSNLLPPNVVGSSNLELPKNLEKLGSSNLLPSEKSGSSKLELPGSSNLLPSKNGQNWGSSNLLPPENQVLTDVPHTSARGSVVVLNNSSLKTKEINTTTTTAGESARALDYWPNVIHLRNEIEQELGMIQDDVVAQQLIDELASRMSTARSPIALLRSLIAAAVRGTFVFSLPAEAMAKTRRRGLEIVETSDDSATEETWTEFLRRQERLMPGLLQGHIDRVDHGEVYFTAVQHAELMAVAKEFGVVT